MITDEELMMYLGELDAYTTLAEKKEKLREILQTYWESKVPKKITIWRGEMKGINLVDAYNQAIANFHKEAL